MKRLQRRGFEVVGAGGDATVLGKPGSPYVVKVGHNPRDPWPWYAAWAVENGGPFVPRVRALKWHGKATRRFYVAVLDRLAVTAWDALEAGTAQAEVSRALVQATSDAVAYLLDSTPGHDLVGVPLWRAALAYESALEHRGLGDVADFVTDLHRAFPFFALDLNRQNWMWSRDGSLVLVDAFARLPSRLPHLPECPRLRAITLGADSG